MKAMRGFSLLECVLALLIFSIGVLSVVQAFNAGLSASDAGVNLDTAVRVADARMETLRQTAFNALAPSAATPDPIFPSYSIAVGVTGVDPKTIEVTVTWPAKGGNPSIRLTTLRAGY